MPKCVRFFGVLHHLILSAAFMVIRSNEDFRTKMDDQALRKHLPRAIIIGAKKAGTRALLEYLRLHSMVKAPGPEVHFFDRYYDRGLKWYRDQMPLSRKRDLVIEKTPRYFITKQAPKRIRRMNPNIKLIVVVRDPVTRALSEYAQIVSKRPGIGPFERMAFLDDKHKRINVSWHAVDTGLYDKHARRWLKAFPRSNVLFVSGEKLVSHPAAEMRWVERFLELPPQITDMHFDLSRRFPCLRRLPSTKPHCLGGSKGRRHPVVSADALNALAQFYRPHNERFFQMAGRNFTSWSR